MMIDHGHDEPDRNEDLGGDYHGLSAAAKSPSASAESPRITSPLRMTTVRIHSPNLFGVLVRPLTIQANQRGARRPVGNANVCDPVMRSAREPGFNIFAFEAGGGSVQP